MMTDLICQLTDKIKSVYPASLNLFLPLCQGINFNWFQGVSFVWRRGGLLIWTKGGNLLRIFQMRRLPNEKGK
jgi:hypothetical protein